MSDYLGNYCFLSTIDEFLSLDLKEWISAMRENYFCVTPYELTAAQETAWKDSFHVLQRTFTRAVKENRDYGKLHILFEYVLPDFDHPYGCRPDVLIVMKDRIAVLEFKSRAIDDENYIYVTKQAKKYKKRLEYNHAASGESKVRVAAVMTSMKDTLEKRERIYCVSPDKLYDILPSLLSLHPEPVEDIYEWTDSAYY